MATSRVMQSLAACGQYGALVASYQRALKARNLAPNSIKTYLAMLDRFGRYLRDKGMPLAAEGISRAQCETFLADLVAEGHKASGLATRHACLKAFFGWLLEEGEISASPMARVPSPRVPETPPPVLTDDQVAALLKACAGKSFEDRRALAIIRLLLDTGLRVSELAGLGVADVDFDRGLVSVMGKGRKPRVVPFGAKTSAALDRYQRERARHKLAALPAFWLGPRQALGAEGVRAIVKERAAAAGIVGRMYPHLFRHFFSHSFLAAGGQETNLMRLAGWSSLKMATKYGASAANQRAIAEHRRLAVGDRL